MEGSAFLSNAKTLYTIAPVTRVRVAADPQAEVVAELPTGTEVEVLTWKDAFVQISAWHRERGRVAGWVHKSFVAGNPPDASSSPTSEDRPAVMARCHACGGENWALVSAFSAVGNIPYVSTGLLDGVAIRARVCRSCGLVQPCLDGEGLVRLERWLNRN